MICDGVNNDTYIQIFNNALTDEFCDKIIKIFNDNDKLHTNGQVLGGVNFDIKKTKQMNFNSYPLNEYDKHLFDNLQEYFSKYLQINNITEILRRNIDDTGYQLQKYVANEGYFKFHDDSLAQIRNNILCIRIFTYLWYLNDVDEGGETEFKQFKIKPRKGSLLIFPATCIYRHSGAMPISNDKYIITGWIWDKLPS